MAAPAADGGGAGAMAPEQQQMLSEPAPAEAAEESCLSRLWAAVSTAGGFLVAGVMYIAIAVLGAPAYILAFLLMALGQLFKLAGGTEHAWKMFVSGQDHPDKVPEQCNRQIGGRSESLRGEGRWKNFEYRVRNSHPLLGVFLAEYGHPFSPFERIGLLILLNSFGYFAAGLKVKLLQHELADEHEKLLGLGYTALCISLPSLALEMLLKHFALLDYKLMLERYDYFGQQRRKRVHVFATQFAKRVAVEKKLKEKKGQGGRGARPGGFLGALFAICDCASTACKACDGCQRCAQDCQDGQDKLAAQLFATYFGGMALFAACLFVYFGCRFDAQLHEAVWQSCLTGIALNFCCLWFAVDAAKFALTWQLEHWQGPGRLALLGKVFPPLPEAHVEFDEFFRLVDQNRDGSLDKAEMEKLVQQFLGAQWQFSKAGWAKVLLEMDLDGNGELSLEELECVRIEYARAAGWWVAGAAAQPQPGDRQGESAALLAA